jgi:hypothetical protein
LAHDAASLQLLKQHALLLLLLLLLLRAMQLYL